MVHQPVSPSVKHPASAKEGGARASTPSGLEDGPGSLCTQYGSHGYGYGYGYGYYVFILPQITARGRSTLRVPGGVSYGRRTEVIKPDVNLPLPTAATKYSTVQVEDLQPLGYVSTRSSPGQKKSEKKNKSNGMRDGARAGAGGCLILSARLRPKANSPFWPKRAHGYEHGSHAAMHCMIAVRDWET
ncbi:hypothetical protein B7463_g12084, partial [Scytalidium lignicola]